ncbi:unnamed protein product [Amoebophrya sp. A120]|nr:unnamed protein product [Amoebophrya sp. A120]|eukprot:GSA120T00009117001.1
MMGKSFHLLRDPKDREHDVAARSEQNSSVDVDDLIKPDEQTSVSCWARQPVLWVVLTVVGFSLVSFFTIYFSVTAASSPASGSATTSRPGGQGQTRNGGQGGGAGSSSPNNDNHGDRGSTNGGGNNGNGNTPNQGNNAGGRDPRVPANLPAHYVAFASEEPQTGAEVQNDARLRGAKALRGRQEKFVALSPAGAAQQQPPPRQLAGQTVGYYNFASIPGTITVDGKAHDKQWLLDNLLVKQQTQFRTVLQELETLGRKQGHYIWWVVPSDRWGGSEAPNERTAVAKDACKELFVRQKYKTLVLYEKILEKFLELLQNRPTGRTDPVSGKKIPNPRVIPPIDFGKIHFWIRFYQRSCEDADWVPDWYKNLVARWDQYHF